MRMLRSSALLLLVLLSSCAHRPKEPTSLAPSQMPYMLIMGEYPPDGSPEQKAEIEKMLKLQENRSPEEIKRCELEVNLTPIGFGAMAMGGWFNEYDFPQTAAMLQEVTAQVKAITDDAKKTFKRKRPIEADDRIVPCVKLERTPSYPSGHATRGMVWALLLAEIFPDHRNELLDQARQFGHDRVLAGMHYPSDVEAGEKLGQVIVHRLLITPDFQKTLERCKEEAHATAHH